MCKSCSDHMENARPTHIVITNYHHSMRQPHEYKNTENYQHGSKQPSIRVLKLPSSHHFTAFSARSRHFHNCGFRVVCKQYDSCVAVDVDSERYTKADTDEEKCVTIPIGEIVGTHHETRIVSMATPIHDIWEIDEETDQPDEQDDKGNGPGVVDIRVDQTMTDADVTIHTNRCNTPART